MYGYKEYALIACEQIQNLTPYMTNEEEEEEG